jgi:tetratricopeptide (TPR) repeat protein
VRVIGIVLCALLAFAFATASQAQTMDPRTAKKLEKVIEFLTNDQHKEAREVLDSINVGRLKAATAATVYEMYAHSYAGAEQYAKAGEYFQKALETEGYEPERQTTVRFQLAQIYMMLEDWDEAISQLRTFFKETESPNSDAYYRLAICYYQKGEPAKAVKPARIAVKKAAVPKEPWLRLLLALYMEERKYKNAIPLLERLVTLYPNKAYWMQLSAVYAELERDIDSLASQQLAYAQGLLTEDREIRRLGQMFLFHDLPYRAGLVLEKGLEEEVVEGDSEAWELLGNSWLAAKEYDRSLPPLQKAAEIAESGDIYARLGRVYIQREEWGEASESLASAIEKGDLDDPGNTWLLYGVSQYNQKKYKSARSKFYEALKHEKSETYARQWIKVVNRELDDGSEPPPEAADAAGATPDEAPSEEAAAGEDVASVEVAE